MTRQYTSIAITGAARGIGKALAIEACKKGYSKLFLLGRSNSELEAVKAICIEIQEKVEVYCYHFDLDDFKSMQLSIEQIAEKGMPEVWVHNAGVSMRALYSETSEHTFDTIFNRNFHGTEKATRYLLPHLLKQHPKSHIVLINSIAGQFGFPLRSAYSASKSALKGLFETIRLEEVEQGLEVTIIYPGRIHTDISKHALNAKGEAEGIMDPGQAEGLSVDKCAKSILKAVHSCKKDVYVGGKEIILAYLKRYIPAIFYSIVSRISAR